ncbi:MAG: enoyl-ACP reductase FabI [Acidimicrobiales bacterium]
MTPRTEGGSGGILAGKRLLVTGIVTDASLAFSAARMAQEQGAEVVVSGWGRGLSLTRRAVRKLPIEPVVLEMDVTTAAQVEAGAREMHERWDRLDGLLHAIAFAPPTCLGRGILAAEWPDVATTLEVSAYSLKTLVHAFRPLLEVAGAHGGASVVALDFDASVTWPLYDWMGVAKAALESLTRYLARELGPSGVKVNLVAAGPVRTMATRAMPGFRVFQELWDERAPLGWSEDQADAVARACAVLMSDWLPMTTGERLHIDGGFHSVGA